MVASTIGFSMADASQSVGTTFSFSDVELKTDFFAELVINLGLFSTFFLADPNFGVAGFCGPNFRVKVGVDLALDEAVFRSSLGLTPMTFFGFSSDDDFSIFLLPFLKILDFCNVEEIFEVLFTKGARNVCFEKLRTKSRNLDPNKLRPRQKHFFVKNFKILS